MRWDFCSCCCIEWEPHHCQLCPLSFTELPMNCHCIQMIVGKKNISQNLSDWKGAHLFQPLDQNRVITQSVLHRALSSWVLKSSKDRFYAASLGNLLQYLVMLIVKNVFLVWGQDIPSFSLWALFLICPPHLGKELNSVLLWSLSLPEAASSEEAKQGQLPQPLLTTQILQSLMILVALLNSSQLVNVLSGPKLGVGWRTESGLMSAKLRRLITSLVLMAAGFFVCLFVFSQPSYPEERDIFLTHCCGLTPGGN